LGVLVSSRAAEIRKKD